MDGLQKNSLPSQGSRTPRDRRSGSIVPATTVSSSNDGPSVMLPASTTSKATIAVGCAKLDEKSSTLEKDIQIDKQNEDIVYKDGNDHYEHESGGFTMKNAKDDEGRKVKKERECTKDEEEEEETVDEKVIVNHCLADFTHETNRVKKLHQDFRRLLTKEDVIDIASIEKRMKSINRGLNAMTMYIRSTKKEVGKLKNRENNYKECVEQASREKELFYQRIGSLKEMIQRQDKIIQDKNRVTQDMGEMIDQKNRIIKEKEDRMDGKNNLIKRKIEEVEERDLRISDLEKDISKSVEFRKTLDLHEDIKDRSERMAALNMRFEKIRKERKEIYTLLYLGDNELKKIKMKIEEDEKRDLKISDLEINISKSVESKKTLGLCEKIKHRSERIAALNMSLEKIRNEKEKIYTSLCQDDKEWNKIIKRKIEEDEERDFKTSDVEKNISSSVESKKTLNLREEAKYRSERMAALSIRLEKIMKETEEVRTSLCQESGELSKIKGQLDECLMVHNQSMIKINEGKERMAMLKISLEQSMKEKEEVCTLLCQEGEKLSNIKRLIKDLMLSINP